MSNYQSNRKAVEKAITQAEKRALEAIGVYVVSEAVLRAPVGQYEDGTMGGNLRSSINHQVNEGDRSVAIGTAVEYAPFVEFGTGRRGRESDVSHPATYAYGGRAGMKAQPYLTPAVDENLDKIKKLAAEMMHLDDRKPT